MRLREKMERSGGHEEIDKVGDAKHERNAGFERTEKQGQVHSCKDTVISNAKQTFIPTLASPPSYLIMRFRRGAISS